MSERERFGRALRELAYAEWNSKRPLMSESDTSPLQALLVAIDMTILPRFIQVRNEQDKPLFTIFAGNRRLLEFVDPGSAFGLKDFNGLISEGPEAMDAAASQSLANELLDVLDASPALTVQSYRGLSDDHAGGIGVRADTLAQSLDILLYGGRPAGVADPIGHLLQSAVMSRFGWMRFSGTELTESGAPAADKLEDVDPTQAAILVHDVLSAAAPDQAAEFLILGNRDSADRLVLCSAGDDRLLTCLPEPEAMALLTLWDNDIAPGLG